MKKPVTLLLISLYLFQTNLNTIFAQDTYADTLNCQGGTPTYIVDLSSNPDSAWVSTPSSRAGSCCVPPDNNCVQFVIELSPLAVGIIFTLPDGCGAAPTGSLFYQVDCGPLTTIGTPLCLSGTGPFVLTFCKPGNNANCYGIESIPEPQAGVDVITADGCIATLSVSGLDLPTITWNSVSPGLPQDYNSYLDCPVGCDIVTVTPQPGYPPSIDYQVCGEAIGACASTPFCDTINVTIVPTLFAEISPINPSICFGSPGTTITANPIGGAAPYNYLWNTGDVTQSLFVTTPGTYYVQITDATDCPAAYDTIVVTQFANTITADAGPDMHICASLNPSVNLNGIATGTTTGVWTNGSGTFSPDSTNLNAIYTASPDEVLAGYSELYLTTTNNGTCPPDSDTLIIFLHTFTTLLDTNIININCFNLGNGAIDLILTGGALPATYQWQSGQLSEDIVNLIPDNYQVMVTDSNGCVDSLSASINEPPPLMITDSLFSIYPSGTNISCFGLSDGFIDITVEGGVPNYTFYWSNGANTEDLFNVPAGIYSVLVVDNNGCATVEVFNLTEPPPLTESVTSSVYPSGDNISCFGFSDGSANLIISGGSPAYNYLWSNGSSTEDLSNIPAGNYSVTVTDLNGCVITSSITLTEPSVLTESITSATYPSGDNISCFGLADGSIDLTILGGSPTYNFSWSNGSSAEDLTNIPAGNYNVTVTDLNGCTINSTITLTEPVMLSIGMTPSVFPGGYNVTGCGLDGTIDLTINGGSPLYNYEWNNGSVSEDLSGLDEGLYSVVVTDINGCTIEDSIYMNAPAPMAANGTVSSYTGGWNISCPDASDGSIDVTVTGGVDPYHFSWSNGSLSEDLSGIPAGSYSVSITDAHGCELVLDFDLIQPPPLASTIEALQYFGGWNVSCFGENDGAIDLSVTGGTGPYFFSWNNGAGTEDLTGITAGSYDVTYTDQNGCTGTTSIVLNQPPVLTATISVLSNYYGMEVSCEGEMDGKLAVSPAGGTPDYSFMWNTTPVQTGSSAGNLGEGTYIVTVTDVNGCVTTDTITLNANPLPEVILPDPLTACYGEMVIVDVSSNMSYGCELTFSTGQILSDCGPYPMFFDYVGCIDAELTVISAEECENTVMIDNYICFHPEPDAAFVASPNTATTLHPDVQFWNYSNGGASYEWDFGDGEFSFDYDTYHFYDSGIEGEYEINLYVTSEFGCVDTATQIIKIVEEFAMYVPNVFTPDANDYNNTFLPVFGGGFDPESYTLLIYDRWGELVFESHDTNIGWDGTYKNGICQDGVYVWVIQIDDKLYQLPTRYEGHVVLLK